MVLYRDDDINKYTNVDLMKDIHTLFTKHNKIHTVAVEMEDIWQSKEVWYWLMTAPNLEIGLHGWKHEDYSELSEERIYEDLKKALDYWDYYLKKGKYAPRKIKTFYPPWNYISDDLRKVCEKLGLTIDNRVGGEVYNFHWWSFNEEGFRKLEEVLRV